MPVAELSFIWLASCSLVSVALDLSMTEEEGLPFALECPAIWWLLLGEEVCRDLSATTCDCYTEDVKIDTEFFFSVICWISSSFIS